MAGMTVPADEWGPDHASLLAYIETRVVDYKGRIDRSHLRMNGAEYPTRLKDGAEPRPGHNDLDVISDLYAYGLLVQVGVDLYSLSELGWRAAHRVRRARAGGLSRAEVAAVLRQAVTGSSS